jgi:hypothetical protein
MWRTLTGLDQNAASIIYRVPDCQASIRLPKHSSPTFVTATEPRVYDQNDQVYYFGRKIFSQVNFVQEATDMDEEILDHRL